MRLVAKSAADQQFLFVRQHRKSCLLPLLNQPNSRAIAGIVDL
jgi:hypothetical protein